MLVLSRKPGERLVINDNITVVVHRISGNRVTLGVEAPNDVRIIRGELAQAVREFRPGSGSDDSRESADVVPFPQAAYEVAAFDGAALSRVAR